MNRQLDPETETGLRFFGKMSASISHEIKNVMAIINESAGLLEDYSLMAEKGVPVNPERLKTVSERVAAQIRRADGIAKNLNSLAHSVDEFHKSVGLSETLALLVGLGQRFADMRSVILDFHPPSDASTIITSPFHLLNILWCILDFAMDISGPEKTVRLTFETGPKSVKISFMGVAALTTMPDKAFPTEKESSLLHLLGAEIQLDAKKGEISLVLPKDVSQNTTV